MAGKENDDFELNLKDADGGVGSIDALLAADGNDAPAAGGNGNGRTCNSGEGSGS